MVSRLGAYDAFTPWTGRPRPWGQGARSQAWFGGDVVTGLVTLLQEHRLRERSRPFDILPAAIGCVPWLDHRGVAEQLARLSSCCIVVDKGTRTGPALASLAAGDNGLPNVLPGLRERLPGGDTVVLGPSGPMPDYHVGPVRVVGMKGEHRGKPLLHAKLLVLGDLKWGEDDFGHEHRWFQPTSVWSGSANWTTRSQDHLETATWTEDVELVRAATDFLDDLIGFSEPWTSSTSTPRADLVTVEYDADAMREAMLADEPWPDEHGEPRWADDPYSDEP